MKNLRRFLAAALAIIMLVPAIAISEEPEIPLEELDFQEDQIYEEIQVEAPISVDEELTESSFVEDSASMDNLEGEDLVFSDPVEAEVETLEAFDLVDAVNDMNEVEESTGENEETKLQNALGQIRSRHYGEADKSELVRLGLVFSETHRCLTRWEQA